MGKERETKTSSNYWIIEIVNNDELTNSFIIFVPRVTFISKT